MSTSSDPIQNLTRQLAGIVDPSSSGGAWGTKAGKQSGAGFGPEGFLKKMAENFYNQTGLSDLSKLGVRTTTEYDFDPGTSTSTPYEVNTYYNKDTGEPVNFSGNLGGYGEGPGWTHTSLSFAGDKPVLRTTGEDTNSLAGMGPVLTALSFVPGVAPFAMAINAANAAYNYDNYLPAAMAAFGLSGVGEGLSSSISSSLANAGIPSTLANIGANALTRAGIAGLTGQDAGDAFVSGALKGAFNSSDTTVGGIGADSIYGANGIDYMYGDPNEIYAALDIDEASGGGGMSDFDYVSGGTEGQAPYDWGGDFSSAEAETAGTNKDYSDVAKTLGLTPNQVKALLKSSFGSASDPLAKSGLANLLSPLDKILRDSLGIGLGDAAKYASMAGNAKMAYDDAKKAREEAKGTPFKSSAPYQAVTGPGGVTGFKRAAAGGGIGSLDLARGGRALPPRYLDGHSDGMADKVPAHIDNRRPAALSDGEFVIPADVVSHLGNGNSNAGAKRLYKMMDRIRAARTGNPKQGKQINPDKFLPR